MSLMQRAQSAQAQAQTDAVLAYGCKDAAASNSAAFALRRVAAYETLKEQVQRILPPATLGKLIEQNPYQAKNEIRLACERVFKENPYLCGKEEQQALLERYNDMVFGLGPLEEMLADEDITEIMVNGSRGFFYEKEGLLFQTAPVFANDAQVYALIDKIVSPLGRRVDESSPMVNARLPEGHRVNVVIPPLALDGPTVTIRKFRHTIFSLDELMQRGSFDASVKTFMAWAVKQRCNIAVSGGTGSGKTTLLNALSCEIPQAERIITIEDSAELKFEQHNHVVRLEARPKNAEGVGEVTIKDLVINALRMRPDRIVVGECRGAEALDMLQAMNTGHDGSLTTLHANSAQEAISRLVMMVRYGAELPVEVIEAQIATALDLVVQTARDAQGKRFVSALVGYSYDQEKHKCCIQTYFSFDHLTRKGRWLSYPSWLSELSLNGIASSKEVALWKTSASLA